MPPETCPNCGADVPRQARACPDCGADETTGWSDNTSADGLDLPDESFDYDGFVAREFGASPKPRHLGWVWWLAGLGLVAVLLWLWVFSR
jgi:hypothetical protein